LRSRRFAFLVILLSTSAAALLDAAQPLSPPDPQLKKN
jgi:hypothetical protein